MTVETLDALSLAPPLRPARPADGPVLAQLVFMAGDGLPLVVWRQHAEDGEDPWAFGARRQAEKAARGGITVVDEGDGAIAGLTGYVIGSEPEPLDAVPALFRPLQELENRALDSWYVNVLAALPAHRGRGWGRRLLEVADRSARATGLSRTSIIVADDNVGARRLYERVGYRETARATAVKDGWDAPTTEWILMIKPLD